MSASKEFRMFWLIGIQQALLVPVLTTVAARRKRDR
ncbi:hypothetical protein SAMN05192530_106104 [Aureimonas jatrophae]|uniref:Uncharacterized protein n=1 Tax=Aureimonas jatrophae TaxID=1166073 RepID=A0A1H0JBF7_9HYPH|nr:hypothetical protein SAMN05192530_106104 [Aureimonas jatrophae]